MNAVNLEAKLVTFAEHWQPRTVAQFNHHGIMVVKAQGEFVWHDHMESAGTLNTGDPATAAERREI